MRESLASISNALSLSCILIFGAFITRPSSTSGPSTALTAASWRRFTPLRSMCGLPSLSMETKSAMFTRATLAISVMIRLGVKLKLDDRARHCAWRLRP